MELLNIQTESRRTKSALETKRKELQSFNGGIPISLNGTTYTPVTLPTDFDTWKVEALTADASLIALEKEKEIAQRGFAAGGTVLIGQLAGAGRDGEIRKSVGSIMLFFLYVGLAVSILTYALAQQLVSLMKIPVEAEAASVSYLRICGAGMLFSTGYHVFAAVMRGLGDSRGPMIFIGFTCCVNVVLDFLFVARLHLGVTGTAYATVIAQALSVLFSAVQLRLKHQRLFTPRTRPELFIKMLRQEIKK